MLLSILVMLVIKNFKSYVPEHKVTLYIDSMAPDAEMKVQPPLFPVTGSTGLIII
ncbi:MAG: hypothetical protein ABJA57_02435 [Ginsengibacter sp.]